MELRVVLMHQTNIHIFFCLNSLSYWSQLIFFLTSWFSTSFAGFEVWSKLHKLEILDLSFNGNLDESSIPSLVAVSSLRSLFLHHNAFKSNLTIQRELSSSLVLKTI